MRLLAEASTAAGNVLLSPLDPTSLSEARGWRRGLIVGSRRDQTIHEATSILRTLAPKIDLDVAWSGGRPASGIRRARRQRYDVVCVLLTGEGFAREKLAAMLSGAQVALAYGANRQWYRIRLPAFHPGNIRWWARLILATILSLAYLRPMAAVGVVSLLRRLIPPDAPTSQPGVPTGRAVTFIVPTYNQRHMMDFCLPPLIAEAGDAHQVLVVDDASVDDTADYVRSHYPQVRLIRLPKNRGFGGAVRAGIAASNTPLYALINTDVQIRPGYLDAILPHFDAPDTFAVCSRIELPGGSPVETGNVAPAWSGVLEPYHVPPSRPGPILYAGGASSVFDRAKYEALGRFETIYRPLYFEDIDLGYRAWRRGWRSLFEPSASVFHKHRAWIGARFGNAFANETFLKNGLLFVWKNVRDATMLAQHLAYVWARLFREILDGEGTIARAVLRALPLCPLLMVKRWGAHRIADLPDSEILTRARPPVLDHSAEVAAE